MRQPRLKSLLLVTAVMCASSSYAGNEELCSRFNAIQSSEYGVQAAHKSLDELMPLFLGPTVSKTGQSLLTVNKMGFDVLDNSKSKSNWLLDEFYILIRRKPGVVLDVGCGYGNLALTALSSGNIVIANDIAVEHLIEVRRRGIANSLVTTNLYLNNQFFPYGIRLPRASLDVVMLHRTLHFSLLPRDIEDGFAMIYEWLKDDGKLFMVVMAPQHKSFAEWFLPIYNRRWENGDKWPGTNLPVKQALPDQAYNLPEYLHVMDERPLRYALEKHGFKIEKIGFIDMKHFGKAEEKRDGHEAIGVIAVKDLSRTSKARL